MVIGFGQHTLRAHNTRSILTFMSAIHQLEEAVRTLSTEERAAFRAWFAAFDNDDWDRQMEIDVAAGRLDWLYPTRPEVRHL